MDFNFLSVSDDTGVHFTRNVIILKQQAYVEVICDRFTIVYFLNCIFLCLLSSFIITMSLLNTILFFQIIGMVVYDHNIYILFLLGNHSIFGRLSF